MFRIGSNQMYLLLQQVWVTDLLTHQLSNSVTLFHWTDKDKIEFIKDHFYILNLFKRLHYALPISNAPFNF